MRQQSRFWNKSNLWKLDCTSPFLARPSTLHSRARSCISLAPVPQLLRDKDGTACSPFENWIPRWLHSDVNKILKLGTVGQGFGTRGQAEIVPHKRSWNPHDCYHVWLLIFIDRGPRPRLFGARVAHIPFPPSTPVCCRMWGGFDAPVAMLQLEDRSWRVFVRFVRFPGSEVRIACEPRRICRLVSRFPAAQKSRRRITWVDLIELWTTRPQGAHVLSL